jgi:predicted transcriptional regulator
MQQLTKTEEQLMEQLWKESFYEDLLQTFEQNQTTVATLLKG